MLTAILLYTLVLFAISLAARSKVEDVTDYLVAGRKLGLGLATATLLATWFGAGTLLAASDEVYRRGLPPAALDPLGAGLCLMLAGLLLARPLRRAGYLTLADLFRERYDGSTERLAAILMVPSFFGWIAAQYVSLAAVLARLFGLDPMWGILLVALIGTGYTYIGGMWSVTLTDALQMVLIVIGLFLLAHQAWGAWREASTPIPAHLLQALPTGGLQQSFDLVALAAVGALGNLPGQDLAQRILSARDEKTARRACFLSAAAYLLLGTIPVLLALAAHVILPAQANRSAVVVALAQKLLTGPMAIVFVLALISAVMSSMDSAILAPAAILAQNVLIPRYGERHPPLWFNRMAVLFVAGASLVLAYLGESAFALLEQAYVLPMVTLLVPLVTALRSSQPQPRQARAAMLVGLVVWLSHAVLGWPYLLGPLATKLPLAAPISVAATLLSALAYRLARGAPAAQNESTVG